MYRSICKMDMHIHIPVYVYLCFRGENVVRNPYRWLPRKDEKDKKDKKKAAERRAGSPSQVCVTDSKAVISPPPLHTRTAPTGITVVSHCCRY